MARYGQRPENALKRANEFIDVGKPARALDTLQEVFRNKKWAYNWSESVLEPIMFKYLDLCVELKKSHIAKEGLFQYRNMFQSVNVGSLENVIRGYLRMAEEKTENAREQSAQAVVDIDDLDNVATPESILLSAVSGEDAQDRSDRTILTPWVKFLWESYCQCLELLRTNAHVETLYHDIARMAFQFCLKYNRKTEFRKLCDKLRKHLEDICKLPAQVANVSISKPETQQLNLETRLYQLESAIQMELWQEAYKAIEDIHGLMNLSKKLPVPKTMANYYHKLAMVFWKAGNYLFHAAALFKLFQLSKEMKKNITPEELQRMACSVLIATLAIPLPSAHPEFDRFIETDKSPLEKAQRLAVLLGLFQPPTRASLLKDIVRVNVVNLASPQLQDLYNWLEVEFHPLMLCNRVQTVIESLQADENSTLVQYIPALQDVTLVRLVRQVAQVYQTVEFSRLIDLAKFTTPFHMERLLVDCVRHNDMQIRIDHKKQCVHFGIDLSESQREDNPEGPTLQSMPSEQIRNQLVNMATVLHQAINIINPTKKKLEREKLRSQMVTNYHEHKVQEHQRILQRRRIIEDRKEFIERLNTVREEEEHRRLEEMARQQALAEQRRLDLEREERERKRALNEIQQIKDRHLKEKMHQISQTSHGQKILKKLDEDDIKKMDADQIAAREAEELQKERRELQAKLKSQEKKVDYFERAKRLEEIPLLQASMEERQLQDQAFWEQQEQERINAACDERKLSVATQERLARMRTDKTVFLDKLMKERNVVYEDKLRDFEKLLAEERKKRLAQRKDQRKQERRAAYLKQKEEEEERKRVEQKLKEEKERERLEELARVEQEEKERVEREEKEKEYKLKQEMLERAAAKQKQREEEIERKLEEENQRMKDVNSGWRGKVAEREARRDDTWRKPGERVERTERTERSEEKKPERPEAWRSSRMRDVDRVAPDRGAPDPRGDSWRNDRFDRREDRREERDRFDERRREDREPRREEKGDREREREDRPVRDDRREERDRRGDERERRGDERRGTDHYGERREDNRREDRFPRERREERDGGERRDDRDRGSWRSGPKDEERRAEEPIRRSMPSSRGREPPNDWRSGKDMRRDDGPRRDDRREDGPRRDDRRDDGPRRDDRRDDGPRRDDRRDDGPRRDDRERREDNRRDDRRDDRRGPPRNEKPREQQQPESEDGWSHVSKRR